jgi:hypothetical protein
MRLSDEMPTLYVGLTTTPSPAYELGITIHAKEGYERKRVKLATLPHVAFDEHWDSTRISQGRPHGRERAREVRD